jgi:outer membrane biosynthesis protein TonB
VQNYFVFECDPDEKEDFYDGRKWKIKNLQDELIDSGLKFKKQAPKVPGNTPSQARRKKEKVKQEEEKSKRQKEKEIQDAREKAKQEEREKQKKEKEIQMARKKAKQEEKAKRKKEKALQEEGERAQTQSFVFEGVFKTYEVGGRQFFGSTRSKKFDPPSPGAKKFPISRDQKNV